MKGVASACAALVWLTPALALACPVCFSATEANRDAFLGTTVFLSLLPLLFIGGVVFVLRQRAKRGQIPPTVTSPLSSINPEKNTVLSVSQRTGNIMDSKG